MMPWCPKCKCEYEEGVMRCADCDVELVDSVEEIVDWRILVKVKEQKDVDEIIEYLHYSGIEEIQQDKMADEEGEAFIALSVLSQDQKKARQCLHGYMLTKIEEKKEAETEEDEDEEVELINEYETEDFGDDTMVKDLKSSVYTFGLVGAGLVVVSILSFTEVVKISFSDKYLFSGLMLVIGIAFIGIAINSKKRVGKEEAHMSNRDQTISNMLTWFEESYDLDSYLIEAEWYDKDMDEGEIYYKMMDQLKRVIAKAFPDVEQKMVNSAAEIIFEKMMNK